jgi:hypothetical protein
MWAYKVKYEPWFNGEVYDQCFGGRATAHMCISPSRGHETVVILFWLFCVTRRQQWWWNAIWKHSSLPWLQPENMIGWLLKCLLRMLSVYFEADSAIQSVNGECRRWAWFANRSKRCGREHDVSAIQYWTGNHDRHPKMTVIEQGTMTGTQKMTVDCCIQERWWRVWGDHNKSESTYLGALCGSSASIVWNFGTAMILITGMCVTGHCCKGWQFPGWILNFDALVVCPCSLSDCDEIWWKWLCWSARWNITQKLVGIAYPMQMDGYDDYSKVQYQRWRSMNAMMIDCCFVRDDQLTFGRFPYMEWFDDSGQELCRVVSRYVVCQLCSKAPVKSG